ncbi:hypothetical protein [Sphingobacterium sp. SYP-B4668]|nr:hypothetical protein [Sphingobacterium sp. SYP-B4668]
MKNLRFSAPVTGTTSIGIQDDVLDHFYPHFHQREEIDDVGRESFH